MLYFTLGTSGVDQEFGKRGCILLKSLRVKEESSNVASSCPVSNTDTKYHEPLLGIVWPTKIIPKTSLNFLR